MTRGAARARRVAAALALTGLLLGGCTTGEAAGVPADRSPTGVHGPSPTTFAGGVALEGTLVVLAAASLTDVLTTLATTFEQQHPALTVRTSFAASSSVVAQAVAGAPADVVVTASPATMRSLTDAVGGEPVVVASNRLQIAVPAGNPGDVRSLADLGDAARTIALCAPEAPCGAVGGRVLAQAGVTAAPDTLEQDVRAVLTRLRLDEADAGLVYRTDVLAAGGTVEGLDLPADVDGTTDYPALALPGASNPRAAAAFVALLTGPDGRQALADAGFDLP